MSTFPGRRGGNAARSFVDTHVRPPRQRALLHGLLDHFPKGERSPYIDVPLFVYGGITGRMRKALPLTALGTFLFLGTDIIDDISDGDAAAHWPGHDPAELQLGAGLFLSALPQLLIARLDTTGTIRSEIQRRFARGLLEAAAGQQMERDLAAQASPDPEKVVNSAGRKSGGIATLAAIAAMLAGADRERIRHLEGMGRDLAIALQLASDFHDLFQAPSSRDLRNGIRTMPIALYLKACSGPEKKTAKRLLEEARTDRSKRNKIKTLLASKGIGRLLAFVIELHCERARKHLHAADLRPGYRERIRSLIDTASLSGS